MKQLIAAGVVTLVVSGCATSNMSYVPPSEPIITNTKTINQPFDQIWDKMVKELSSDFFVINNIDKSSRLINISFSTDKPSTYVDCGITNRSFENARGKQNYRYATADSTLYTFTNTNGVVFNASRKTRLEGRANIYVAPEAAGTNITVNTKYVLNVQTSAFNVNGVPAGNETSTIDFSTKTPQRGGSTIGCNTLGVIERKILDTAGN